MDSDEKLRDTASELDEIFKNSNAPFYKAIEGILERAKNEKKYLLQETRLNAISNCILNFTSATEYFLIDLIEWKLQDKNLFKRALDIKDTEIRKFDIVDFDSIEDLRKKYIKQISAKFSEGELWAKKMQNAAKLFDIPFDKTSKTIKSIDTVWMLRNRFAHLDRLQYLPISFMSTSDIKIEIIDVSHNKVYFDFCIELLDTMSQAINDIDTFQNEVYKKWHLKNDK
ncbi:MAG: hypothetical protein JNK00_10415 [Flavipsychrobacter sp.]|nr:hypothetical protein [Flavipsychrobacter sp.]